MASICIVGLDKGGVHLFPVHPSGSTPDLYYESCIQRSWPYAWIAMLHKMDKSRLIPTVNSLVWMFSWTFCVACVCLSTLQVRHWRLNTWGRSTPQTFIVSMYRCKSELSEPFWFVYAIISSVCDTLKSSNGIWPTYIISCLWILQLGTPFSTSHFDLLWTWPTSYNYFSFATCVVVINAMNENGTEILNDSLTELFQKGLVLLSP